MDNDSEEDLKMMCLIGKKELRKLEMPAARYDSGVFFIAIFPCLTISKMDFSFSNPRNCSIPPPYRFRCMISTVDQTAVR